MSRNPITIEALETIDAIDRRGSFAKAAEELNKATSAVSYIVQKLEEQLDIALFQRQGRRSILTPAGQFVLSEGRTILASSRRLANKAQEIATGWESQITIGLESTAHYPSFFNCLSNFLSDHPSIEVDVIECVLNGGWEALEHNRVDLIVGAPGPVPQQKGFRIQPLQTLDLVPVISKNHPLANDATNLRTSEAVYDTSRIVVTHDTSVTQITRSAGISGESRRFYVQNTDQKVAAICAGVGIGHLPRYRIQNLLDCNELIELTPIGQHTTETFLAWRLSNKGQGLRKLSTLLTNMTE